MAHRDRSHFGGRPSLSGHNGHGWSGGRLDPDANGPNLPMLVGQSNICSARLFQTSTCSAIARASSTSIPRYLTVLSILVWPSKSCTARRFPVRR